MGGFATGFALLAGLDGLRDPMGDPPENMRRAIIAIAIVLGIGTLCAWNFRGKMGREEAEKETREREARDERGSRDDEGGEEDLAY